MSEKKDAEETESPKTDCPLEKLTKLANRPSSKSALQDLRKLIKKSPPGKKQKQKGPVVRRLERDSIGRRAFPFKGQTKRSVKKKSKEDFPQLNEDLDESINESDGVTDGFQTTAYKAIEMLTSKFVLKSNKKKKKSWQERMEGLETVWEEERNSIISIVVSQACPPSTCQTCFEKPVCVSCPNCIDAYFCYKCDSKRHAELPFHNRESFADGYSRPLGPMEVLNENHDIVFTERCVPLKAQQCECGSYDVVKQVVDQVTVVITLTGRFELSQYEFVCQECDSKQNPFNLKTILLSGYWPCSPRKFTCLIQTDVFKLWDQFRKHMPGSSEKSFLDTLNAFTQLHGRVGKIVPSSFSQAFKEWCFVNFEIDSMQNKNWTKCPCCSIKQHSCHIDGNCKLYRYRSSGSRRRESYYKGTFIVPDEEVQNFVSSVYSSPGINSKSQQDISCGGNWAAARNVVRKKGSVDVTGLELATCRHQIGQKALNMKQGELFAYGLYLIKHHMLPNNVEFVFADVMCKLWKFMKKADLSMCSDIKGALSVMHAKGHSLDCQVLWDGEWIEGTGRSTGEECEQVFSYLSRCCNTTKYQRPENREETLTELMMFWNQRKCINLAEALAKKLRRVRKDLQSRKSELEKTLNNIGILPGKIMWNELLEDVRCIAQGGSVNKLPNPSINQACMLLYNHLKPLASSTTQIPPFLHQMQLPELFHLKIPLLSKKKAQKESVFSDSLECFDPTKANEEFQLLLKNIIRPAFRIAIEQAYFERIHWNTRMKKTADSSKQRFVFRKKMCAAGEKLKGLFTQYAGVSGESPLSLADIENGLFPWRVLNRSKNGTSISDTDKRVILELNLKIKRCEEELCLLKRDMESYLVHYSSSSYRLNAEIVSLDVFPPENVNENYINGQKSLLRKGIAFCDEQLRKGVTLFCGEMSPEMLATVPFEVENIEEEAPEPVAEEEEEEANLDLEHELDIDFINATGFEISSSCSLIEDDIQFSSSDTITDVVLPSVLCQSRICGRNGSNACTTISLLVGYFITKSGALDNGFVLNNILPIFIGCIEIGNVLHKDSAFLFVQESLPLFPDIIEMEAVDERNVFLVDLEAMIIHYRSIVKKHQFVIVVGGGKSFACCFANDRLYMFDSHAHGELGASITSMSAISELGSKLSVAANEVMFCCIVDIVDT